MFNLIPWGAGRKADPFALMRREFDNVVDRVEAPGFEAQDFDVEVSGGMLTVRAEHKEAGKKDEEAGERWTRLERSVTLPEGLDLDKVEATYRNGVLELHLPKHPDALPR